jgi:hypothetical protein
VAYTQAPYRPDVSQRESTPEERRNITKWMLGFGAFFALTLALLALQLFQATSEGTAHTSLVRVTAALTEIDLLLDHHYAELGTQAETAAPGDTLTLEDYPIAIVLTPDDVLNNSRDDLRIIILDSSAERLYQDGTGVLRELSEGASGTGRFSAAGVAKTALDFQTEQNHQRIGVVMFVLFVIALVLCGWGRLGVLGVLLSAASGAVLLAGALFYLYADATSADDAVREAFLNNTTDLTMIAIRNGIAGVAAGLALCGIAFAGHVLTRHDGRAAVDSTPSRART